MCHVLQTLKLSTEIHCTASALVAKRMAMTCENELYVILRATNALLVFYYCIFIGFFTFLVHSVFLFVYFVAVLIYI